MADDKNDAKLQKAEPRTGPSLTLLAILIAILVLFSVGIASLRPLTPLEAVLLDLFLVGLSIWMARLYARKEEQGNISATQQKLGESALRRIDDLMTSCQRLLVYVEHCTRTLNDSETVDRARTLDWFDSVIRLGTEIRSSLESAAEDWRRILPEEFRRRAAVRGEAAEALRSALDEVSQAIKTTQETFSQMAASGNQRAVEQNLQMSLLADQIQAIEQKLSVKIEQIRADAGHPLPSPILVSSKRAADQEGNYADRPVGKMILGFTKKPQPLDAIVKHVQQEHDKPKPGSKTIQDYVNALLRQGHLRQRGQGFMRSNEAETEEGGDISEPGAN